MAGGFGTRLRPITCTVPKPMIPVMNKPMLEHIVDLLKKHHLHDIITLLHFQPEQITSHLGDGEQFGVKIAYTCSPDDLGTAGAVADAAEHLKDPFIVISGDVLTDINLTKAIEFHKAKKALVTIILTRVENPLQFGVVITDGEGRITRFLEKPSWGEVFSDTVNTGLYIIEPEALKYIPRGREFDFSKDLFPLLMKHREPLYGFIADGYWKDVGDLGEYLLAHKDVLEGRVSVDIPGTRMNVIGKDVLIGENTIVEDRVEFKGGVVIGKNCLIKRGSIIANSIIGDNCIVENGARVSGSVVWEDCYIGQQAALKENIIGRSCRIMKNAYISEGVVVADECHIGEDAVLKANIKVWPHKSVEAGSTLSTSLVWGDKWNSVLFGAHGISGLANAEITPELAAKVGAAAGAYFGKGATIATSRDSHKTSRLINRALISGILSGGCNVDDLQVMTQPIARYQLQTSNQKCYIHTRKCPFEPNTLELKFFDSNGMALSLAKQKAIERLFFREDFPRASCEDTGTIRFPHRTLEIYTEGLTNFIDSERIKKGCLKIVIDYSYSAASVIFPQILGRLGIDVISLNAFVDESRLSKDEQVMTASLRQLSNIVQSLSANFGVMLDVGAEKFFIVDETGRILSDEVALALMANLVMRTSPEGARVAVPITASRIFEEMASGARSAVVRTKTSLRAMMDAASAENVQFAGDGAGGFVFPKFQPAFDAMVSICKFAEMLSMVNKPLSHIVKEIPHSNVLRIQVPCPWEFKGTVMRNLIEETKNMATELLDGVKVRLDENDWLLIIPDTDKPFFHIYVESSSPEKSNKLIKEYTDKIKTWQIKTDQGEQQAYHSQTWQVDL